MFTDIFIITIIFNAFCNIQFTRQISLQSTANDQFSTLNSTVITGYREGSIHTIITDDHVSKILDKLGSSVINSATEPPSTTTPHFTTAESSATFTTETSTYTYSTSSVPLFQTKRLPIDPDIVAPDGSLVRNLLSTTGGSMAQFDLPPGMTSNAVEHRSVYEIWYFLSGRGEFWRKQGQKEEIVTVDSNVCITIPVGTQFQFRTIGQKPLIAVAITMPPWPGQDEAILRQGIWNASFVGMGSSSIKTRFNCIYLFIIVITFLIQ